MNCRKPPLAPSRTLSPPTWYDVMCCYLVRAVLHGVVRYGRVKRADGVGDRRIDGGGWFSAEVEVADVGLGW